MCIFVVVIDIVMFFETRISLYSLELLGTCWEDLVDLNYRELPNFVSCLPELKVCATIPQIALYICKLAAKFSKVYDLENDSMNYKVNLMNYMPI